MKPFTSVSTGNDLITYQTARALHMETGECTYSLGLSDLRPVCHSKIVQTQNDPSFRGEERIIKDLMAFGKTHAHHGKPVLFVGGEAYLEHFLKHPALRDVFHVPYFLGDVGERLQNKSAFYEAAARAGIRAPKTIAFGREDDLDKFRSFRFPAILKPEVTMSFRSMHFDGKWKVFTIRDFNALKQTAQRIFAAGFSGTLLLQDFVAGPVSNEYSFSGYVDRDGNFRDVAIGRALMEDPDPDMRGNHLGIVQAEEKAIDPIMDAMTKYVKEVGYRGLINADFKRDENDGLFYIFEVNQRQGASTFYSVMAGGNVYHGLLEDLVEERPFKGTRIGRSPFVWVDCSPKVLRSLLEGEAATLFDKNAEQGIVDHTLSYPYDNGPLRAFNVHRYIHVKDKRILRNVKEFGLR